MRKGSGTFFSLQNSPLIAAVADTKIRKATQRCNTIQRWKRQVCILFVGAARFLYRTLSRCRSARSMHAPEKSDIHRQVKNHCCCQHLLKLIVVFVMIMFYSSAELIFVTNITNYICGEKTVMWRNFSFLYRI